MVGNLDLKDFIVQAAIVVFRRIYLIYGLPRGETRGIYYHIRGIIDTSFVNNTEHERGLNVTERLSTYVYHTNIYLNNLVKTR